VRKLKQADGGRGVGGAPPSCTADGTYLFVGYAHADRARVFPQLRRMSSLGARLWYDEGIHPASQWSEEIAQAIGRCSLFVVMISPHSVRSANVRDEIQYATSHGREVLAIHLERTDLPAGLELQLNARQAILKWQLDDKSYDRKLAAAVSMYASPEPVDGGSAAAEAETTGRRLRWWMLAGAGAVACIAIALFAIGRTTGRPVVRLSGGAHPVPTDSGPTDSEAGGGAGSSPGSAVPAVNCRNANLGYQVSVPKGVYPSGDDATFAGCEAFDFKRIAARSYSPASFLAVPIMFGSLSDPIALLTKDVGDEVVMDRSTTIAGQRVEVVESRSTPAPGADSALLRGGFREYDYLIARGQSVLVAELLTPLSVPAASYESQKRALDELVTSLSVVPATCHDAKDNVHCGEFYWTTTPTNRAASAEATVDPPNPRVGQTVSFRIHVHDPDANNFESTCVAFGDIPNRCAGPLANTGGESPRDIRRRGGSKGSSGPWDPPQPRSGDQTFLCTHVYRAPGDFLANFRFRSWTTGSDVPADQDPYGDGTYTSAPVHVTDGGAGAPPPTTAAPVGSTPPPCVTAPPG
jgi:hypothetical protein